MKFIVYSDGACSNNQNADKRIGAFAAAIFMKKGEQTLKKDVSGTFNGATNNQMELWAVIKAIKEILTIDPGNKPEVIIRSDSQYVIQGATTWLKDWKANNWRTKDNKEIKNMHMWIELDSMLPKINHSFEKVVGDGNDKWNDYCDNIARGLCGSMPKRRS